MNLVKLAKKEPLIVIGIIGVIGFVLGSGKLPISLPSISPAPAAPPPSSTPANVAATAAAPPSSSSWLDGM